MTTTTESEQSLLLALQDGIPLEVEPYTALAQRLSLAPQELLDELSRLRERKLLRRVSPIYDTRLLGYDSSLVAFTVAPEQLEEAAAVVNGHPGVSHNYLRTHAFNMWFTLACSPDSRLGLEATVAVLAQRSGAQLSAILRAVRTFKIGVKLDLDGSAPERAVAPPTSGDGFAPLTEQEKEIVRVTQSELPAEMRPFRGQAEQLGLSEEQLVERLRDFLRRGLIRRFAAVLHHRHVGFRANGMGVWQVSPERIEECGQVMATFSAVSHCYQRTPAAGWPYNLFTMVHAPTREKVEEVLERIRQATGLEGYGVLYSTTELKKQRPHYFGPEEGLWEEAARL